ncbi:cellulose-binding protein, partial [Streptomyces achromogenes]
GEGGRHPGARHAERASRAEAALAAAGRAVEEAGEYARRCEERARARAAEIVAEARVREERIAQETERLLREHGDTWDAVQAHVDSARDRLMTLTGRVVTE